MQYRTADTPPTERLPYPTIQTACFSKPKFRTAHNGQPIFRDTPPDIPANRAAEVPYLI